ncbi:MAG: hypothetical protein IJW06_07695 [Clostridia bacterium]|nr:hypothetical protein [Clostridia bacterium]
MANLTGTQKKKRNQFIALIVAIVVVLAAIFYVVYSSFMAKSAFLANEDFATALATAFDKSARSISKEDLASAKYLEIINSGEVCGVAIGDGDFAVKYDKYVKELDAAEKAEEAGEENVPQVVPLDTSSLKYAEFEIDSKETFKFDDLKYFTGIENVAFSDVTFNVNDFNGANIKRANFSGCGLKNEDLAAIAKKLNLEKVEELVFMGNAIDDWSPVESISDKVILQSYGIQMTEDGQYTIVPSEETLTEYLKAQAEAEAEANKEAEGTDEVAEGEVTEEQAETPEEKTAE